MIEILDGRAASLKAREYFEEVHGTYNVLGFAVEEVTYHDANKTWEINCNFFPGLVSYKLRYKVIVDAVSGKILKVQQLEPKK